MKRLKRFTMFMAGAVLAYSLSPDLLGAQEPPGGPKPGTQREARHYAAREAAAEHLRGFVGGQEATGFTPMGAVLFALGVALVVLLIVFLMVAEEESRRTPSTPPAVSPSPAYAATPVLDATCCLCWGEGVWTGVKCPGCTGTGKWGRR